MILRSKKQIKSTFIIQQKKKSPIQQLPIELLRIILSFYTKSWRQVNRFGSVCRSWKEIADHSSIWLNYPLTFYAPLDYFRLQLGSKLLNREDLISAGNRNPLRVTHRHYPLRAYPSHYYKIHFYDVIQTSPSKSARSTNNLKSSEEAYLARKAFLKLFNEFHELWNWYVRWNSILSPNINFSGLLMKLHLLSLCLQGIATYLLSSIKVSSTANSIPSIWDQWGFICLYISGGIWFLYLGILFSWKILNDLRQPKNSNLKSTISWKDYLPYLSAAIYLTGILTTIALFHYKINMNNLEDPHHHLLPYYYHLPIPFCFFSLLTYFCLLYQEFTDSFFVAAGFGFIVIFSFPISYTMATLYYAKVLIPFLWYTLVPFIPLECILLYTTFHSVKDSLELWRDYFQGKEIAYNNNSNNNNHNNHHLHHNSFSNPQNTPSHLPQQTTTSLSTTIPFYRSSSSSNNQHGSYLYSLPRKFRRLIGLFANFSRTISMCVMIVLSIYLNMMISNAEDSIELSTVMFIFLSVLWLLQLLLLLRDFDAASL